jgi:hypothetical protein
MLGLALGPLSYLIAYLSGWKKLEKSFLNRNKDTNYKIRFRTVRVGLFAYRTSLSFGTDNEYLYIGAAFPLSLTHKPLVIPSQCITYQPNDNCKFRNTIKIEEVIFKIPVNVDTLIQSSSIKNAFNPSPQN